MRRAEGTRLARGAGRATPSEEEMAPPLSMHATGQERRMLQLAVMWVREKASVVYCDLILDKGAH